MLGLVTLLLAQAAVPSSVGTDEVVVTGRRAERELAACLARSCPPAEEVEASLQASVEQFADGRYDDARGTLFNAIRRNRDHAAALPGPVSSLYATLATVAEHEGNTNLWRTSARDNVLVLRQHLGEADPATLREELSFADGLVGTGAPDAADGAYRKVQQLAGKTGQTSVAAGAAFRRAWLALMRNRLDAAQGFADEAVALAGAKDLVMAELREILRARIAIRKGDAGAVDALAARLAQNTTSQPQILYAPPIENINPPMGPGRVQRDSRIRFADVGYWIRPDGRTSEVEILRDSDLGQWAAGIVRNVSKRRYVPLAVEPGHPGLYRIDRFTVRASIAMPTGSHIRERLGDMTVHVIDLTETEAMSAARRAHRQVGPAEQGS